MRSTPLSRLAALALALSVGACSDSTGPTPTPVDLATALSEMSLSTYVPDGFGMTGVSGEVAFTPSGCAFTAASQSFTCPSFTQDGITLTRSYQLLNDAGVPQAAFDAGTIAAIRTTQTVKGSVSIGADALTIDHVETMTLSGLRTGTHVLDGTQQTHFTGTFDGVTADQTIATSIVGLQLPDRNSGSKYPRAGTITITASDVPAPGEPPYVSTTVLTFNGTSRVSITFTYGGYTQRCTMDLAAGPEAGLSCS